MKTTTAFVIVSSFLGAASTGFGYLASKKTSSEKRYSLKNVVTIALPAVGGVGATYLLLTKLGRQQT